MDQSKNKKLARMIKHFGFNCTDLNSTSPTIKLHPHTSTIRGIDATNSEKEYLRLGQHCLYVVGAVSEIEKTLISFHKALVNDMKLDVILDLETLTIKSRV